MSSSSFLRGTARLLACETVIAELIESIGDIIVLDEGERQYDVRPGMHELGVSRFGIQVDHPYSGMSGTIRASLDEMHPTTILKRWMVKDDPLTTLIALLRRPDTTIIAYIFHNAILMPMEFNVPWRGESMSSPVSWSYRGGQVINQIKIDTS